MGGIRRLVVAVRLVMWLAVVVLVPACGGGGEGGQTCDNPFSYVPAITWAGRQWEAKTSSAPAAPRGNVWQQQNAILQGPDLILRIQKSGGFWTAAELQTVSTGFGYGEYSFMVKEVRRINASGQQSDPQLLTAVNVVCGMFLLRDGADTQPEVDIELTNAWSTRPGNLHYTYQIPPEVPVADYSGFDFTNSTHSFLWTPEQIQFTSTPQSGPPSVGTSPGSSMPAPVPPNHRVHVNFYLFDICPNTGQTPSGVSTDDYTYELVLGNFTYKPLLILEPTTGPVGGDAYVIVSEPSTAHDSTTTVFVNTTAASEARAFLYFDLGQIPGTATIQDARLDFTSFSRGGASTVNVDAVAAGGSVFQEGLLTWSNQPSTSGSMLSGIPPSSVLGLNQIALSTSVVQSYIGAGLANWRGLRLTLNGTNVDLAFRPSEYSTVAERPKLVVLYQP